MADKVNEACLTKRELPESLLVFGEALTLLSLVGMSLFTLHAQMIPSFEISCDALYHVNLDGPNGRRPLFTNGKTIRRKLNVFRTVSGLWRRESYALASVVAALSGVWPHVKLLLCAVAPVHELPRVCCCPPSRRQALAMSDRHREDIVEQRVGLT